MRRLCRGATATSVVAAAPLHMPGWKTRNSTRDVRSRERREADRKARQVEKLPRPEALADFQYPFEKRVLSDTMFQQPVFGSHLDTPHLFNIAPPPDFFTYWNVAQFERTDYPPVPPLDHRALQPLSSAEVAAAKEDHAWVRHRHTAALLLRKHGVAPGYFAHVQHSANLSVVFDGQYQRRAQEPNQPPRPVAERENRALGARNFWFTAHLGNYIDLCEALHPPEIFIAGQQGNGADGELYTLMILSPDYPYRTAASANATGFFLNYVVANIPGGGDAAAAAKPRGGDVVVPYVHPLPTEDGGTVRQLCVLFRQRSSSGSEGAGGESAAVPNIRPLSPADEAAHFPLPVRAQYRLHQTSELLQQLSANNNGNNNGSNNTGGGTGSSAAAAAMAMAEERSRALGSLAAVEAALEADPAALTFFTTTWDIPVQEYYERVAQPEPALQLDSELEASLAHLARAPSELRVRARHEPDGAVNMGGDTRQWGQMQDTLPGHGTMRGLWSRRTMLGRNRRPVITPH